MSNPREPLQSPNNSENNSNTGNNTQYPTTPAAPYDTQYPDNRPYLQASPWNYPANGYAVPNHFQSFSSGAIPPSEASNINLNLWLSVFFGWIPALIFYSQKSSTTPITATVYKNNLMFQLTYLCTQLLLIVVAIPIFILFVSQGATGGLAGAFISLAIIYTIIFCVSITYFVISIIAAVSASNQARNGMIYKFPLAFGQQNTH